MIKGFGRIPLWVSLSAILHGVLLFAFSFVDDEVARSQDSPEEESHNMERMPISFLAPDISQPANYAIITGGGRPILEEPLHSAQNPVLPESEVVLAEDIPIEPSLTEQQSELPSLAEMITEVAETIAIAESQVELVEWPPVRETPNLTGPPERASSVIVESNPDSVTGPSPKRSSDASTPMSEKAVGLPSLRLIHGPSPPYLHEAKRAGVTDVVTVIRAFIGGNGKVESVSLVESCGWPGMDRSALNTVRRRWRFEKWTEDKSVSAREEFVRIRWNLNHSAR